MVNDYKDLRVWQQGMDLAERVYKLSSAWPHEERFGLTSQARRAAVSVPSNIAEGYGRGSRGEYVQFLRIARGSLAELETQLLLAQRMGWPVPADTLANLPTLRRQLQALLNTLRD